MKQFSHTPVLYQEIQNVFADLQLHVFVDGTLGAGGHAASLLSAHPEIEAFVGIDQDPSAMEIARGRLKPWDTRTFFIAANFSEITEVLASLHITRVQGILLDIGVSSMQLDNPSRGFSFNTEGPLDMRMDPQSLLTAADIINTWTEQEMGRIFRDYGEEKRWRLATRAIAQAREKQAISTTKQLVEVLQPVFRGYYQNIHPATRIFQALRICVNRELEVLEHTIPKAINLLAPGGRLAIITFHSLEDRILKNAFRFAASDKMSTEGIGGMFLEKIPEIKLITKHPITASDKEVKENPRSRSAKLRVAEKL
jgi:16S rRNA (cytosine1402-N4)-methyltransferase